MHSILYSVYWRAFDISVCYGVSICEYEHHWWFVCYLCVGAVPCVCWRGVWEGHHCGRIIMVIAPKMPFLSASVYLYHIQYHPFLFSSVPSCEDFNVGVFSSRLLFKRVSPPAHYFRYIWHSWISSSQLVYFSNRNKGIAGVTKIWISNGSCQLYCCFRSGLETASVRDGKGPNGNQTGNWAWNIENANM